MTGGTHFRKPLYCFGQYLLGEVRKTSKTRPCKYVYNYMQLIPYYVEARAQISYVYIYIHALLLSFVLKPSY